MLKKPPQFKNITAPVGGTNYSGGVKTTGLLSETMTIIQVTAKGTTQTNAKVETGNFIARTSGDSVGPLEQVACG